jgi:DNA helicase-2/ATP-dependent DNA helicase PcrA
VKLYFDGAAQDYKSIQHLLVDEMQDYTPIQYAVLAKLFSCKMTILGDSNQSVNPYSSSTADTIRPYFKDCDCAELCKSYRSTIEITQFAQGIQENSNLIPIERHGDIPSVSVCNSRMDQLNKILDLTRLFEQSGYQSLGIICKSQKQANELYESVKTVHEDILLLNFTSSEFREGIVISSAHMSKGLEYDQVIVPDVSDDYYSTEMDRSLLYIACTRAMHKLELTYYGKKTRFISKDAAAEAHVEYYPGSTEI